MTEKQPPALARWLVKQAARGNEALVGDLLEEYRRGRSAVWYWRQALTIVVVGRSTAAALALGIVALYILGSYFPIPGANASVLDLVNRRAVGAPFQLFNVLFGGQLSGLTVFALGIGPYISAAFLVQGAALVWRFLNRHAESWRPVPVVASTWCVALVLCAAQAVGLATFLERVSAAGGGLPIVDSPGWTFRFTTLVTLTASTTCLMLLSDQISKRRLGNGMLLVFGAGIVAAVPGIVGPLVTGRMDPFALLNMLVVNTAVVTVVSLGYRRAIERELAS